MSASLVGSEMCIRDRHRAWHLRAARTARPASNRLLGPFACSDGPPGCPVSYTHLTLPTIWSV
eukprot:4640993-Alexandrium_andersonii.AAC.1